MKEWRGLLHGAMIFLLVILAKSEEILIIFAEEARDREGRKALEAKNGP